MSLLTNLLEYALDNYYPKSSQSVDDEVFPSKSTMYDEWFNSRYINGVWYIGEDTSNLSNDE